MVQANGGAVIMPGEQPEIRTKSPGILNRGRHTCRWDIYVLLKNGTYFLKLVANNETQNNILKIIKQ